MRQWLPIALLVIASLAYVSANSDCVNGQWQKHDVCSCRFAFYRKTCDTFIFHDIPAVFTALRILFTVISFCLLVVTLAITVDAMRAKASSYHLVGFGLVCFDCAVQVAVYGSSVETTPGQSYAYVTEVLSILHFILIYVTYTVYLLWWIELNQKFKRIKRGMTRITSTQRPIKRLSYAASDSAASVNAFNETSSSSSIELQSSTSMSTNLSGSGNLSAALDESSSSLGGERLTTDEDVSKRRSEEVTIHHVPEATYTLPKIDSAKSGGSDSSVVESGQPQATTRPRGISVLWHRVAPRGVSARKVRTILWASVFMVNISNGIRVLLYELNFDPTTETPNLVGPIQYMLASVVAWIIIVLGFDLYKRAFLRKLQLSHKSEVTQNIKSVTKTTVIIILVLLVYGVLAVAQSAGGSDESHKKLAMTVYIVRAVVTFVTISLFIHCFGFKSVARVLRGIKSKFKFCKTTN